MKRMGWDDQMRDLKNNSQISRTYWRQMKRIAWDDQMRDLETIDQFHVLPGDG